MAKNSKASKIFRILKRIVLWFFILSIGSTLIFRFIPIPVTPLMLIRCTQQIFSGHAPHISKSWKSIKNISPNLPLAVIASEDQLFKEHWGFDFNAIEKAMKNNNSQKKKKKIKGGSTISQQTAKNVFLWPGRSWIRKGFEVYFTMLIEGLWNKERIMEVYLNVIEMGDGVYGAQAAAQTYYHKDAMNLSQAQCASIAAVLPNPLKWSPIRPTPYIQKRQQWILRNMNNLGEIDLED